MLSTWATSRKIASAGVLIALVALVAVLAGRDSGGASGDRDPAGSAVSATDGKGGGSAGKGDGDGATSGDAKDGGATAGAADANPNGISATPDTTPIPAAPEVTGTKGLHDLDDVVIDAKAEDGKALFGVEMRLCKEGSIIANDGDWIPDYTGQCTSFPLSPGGDGYKVVTSEDGGKTVHATFKVTTGTGDITMDDGSTVQITCDADHPCVLAVKYQFTDGFGFRTYPLTFAS